MNVASAIAMKLVDATHKGHKMAEATKEKMYGAVTTILQAVLGILITVVTALQAWSLTQIVAIREEVASVKASRFTASDGKEVWQAIAAIQQKIATMPSESPPRWFADRIDRMEVSIDKKLSDVERRMTVLEGKK